MSHGAMDAVLPVSCARRVVPRLEDNGYEVKYNEWVHAAASRNEPAYLPTYLHGI